MTTIILVIAIIVAVVLSLIGNLKAKNTQRFKIVAIVAASFFAVFYAIRLFVVDAFQNYASYTDSVFSQGTFIFTVVLRAITMLCVLCIIIAPYFKKQHLNNIIAFVAPIVYVINIIFYRNNMFAILGYYADYPNYSIYEIAFAAECILGIAIGINYFVNKVINKDFSNGLNQLWQTTLAAVLLTILIMPNCTLQNLFGLVGGVAEGFSFIHIIMLLIPVIAIIVGHVILRNFPKKDQWYVLTTLSIITFIQFYYSYGVPFTVYNLPLHLCHAAVILMLIGFIFRIKTIFYFNYLVNILGAIFALLMPTEIKEITGSMEIHFWIEHIMLITLPVLAISLGLFPRPNIKHVGGCLAVFAGYFLLTCFVNAQHIDDGISYFFLNENKLINIAVSIFPQSTWGDFGAFFANLRAEPVEFSIGTTSFKVFPAFWVGIFVVYCLLVFVLWIAIHGLFNVADSHYALHIIKNKKRVDMLNLHKLLKNRTFDEPVLPEEKDTVKIEHFTKIYGGSTNKAVDDFSLTVHGGEVYGFLGHNGAGKSTTIKSLVGIQTITNGSIYVCGYDVEKQSLQAKLNIGYVSDNHAVYEKLTGREYINYVANLYLVPLDVRQERFDKYVKMFNLEDAIDREIKGYSHGMKQKIVVIASLMHNPKVWVLDEPLTGLDPTSSFQIKECMREHADKGNIVFFSSHVIEVVEKICDKICIIGHGKLIGEWDLKELKKSGATLEELYMKYVGTQNLVTEVSGKSAVSETLYGKADMVTIPKVPPIQEQDATTQTLSDKDIQ